MDNLTDIQKSKIEAFCADKEMYNAVRNVILAGLYSNGVIEAGHEHNPLLNGAFSLVSLSVENPIPDEMLGQHLRATWFGINEMESAFNKLTSISLPKVEKGTEQINPAE